jgi:hypothetical protein
MLEDLPSDGGRVVVTLGGGLLRTFVRLDLAQPAYAELRLRMAALEERPAPRMVDPVERPMPAPSDLSRDRRSSTTASRAGLRIARARTASPLAPHPVK